MINDATQSSTRRKSAHSVLAASVSSPASSWHGSAALRISSQTCTIHEHTHRQQGALHNQTNNTRGDPTQLPSKHTPFSTAYASTCSKGNNNFNLLRASVIVDFIAKTVWWKWAAHIVGIPTSPPKSRHRRRNGKLPPLVRGASMRRPLKRSMNSGCDCCHGAAEITQSISMEQCRRQSRFKADLKSNAYTEARVCMIRDSVGVWTNALHW